MNQIFHHFCNQLSWIIRYLMRKNFSTTTLIWMLPSFPTFGLCKTTCTSTKASGIVSTTLPLLLFPPLHCCWNMILDHDPRPSYLSKKGVNYCWDTHLVPKWRWHDRGLIKILQITGKTLRLKILVRFLYASLFQKNILRYHKKPRTNFLRWS